MEVLFLGVVCMGLALYVLHLHHELEGAESYDHKHGGCDDRDS
jgi:hypothetical protein